jgi:putative transposase
LLKSYKTEVNPTEKQKEIINMTIGVCRFVYNYYIAYNKEIYEKEKKFVSGMDFAKWLNVFVSKNPEYSWVKEVSTKSVKHSIMDSERAFKNFFKKKANFPKFKKKNKSEVKMYFVKNDAKTIIQCERHKIKIPTLNWVQIKEKGYIPTNKIIKSGTISKKAGRYYISVLVEVPNTIPSDIEKSEGIGIDLGLNNFAIISNKTIYKNINKTKRIKKLKKKLKREQSRYG